MSHSISNCDVWIEFDLSLRFAPAAENTFLSRFYRAFYTRFKNPSGAFAALIAPAVTWDIRELNRCRGVCIEQQMPKRAKAWP